MSGAEDSLIDILWDMCMHKGPWWLKLLIIVGLAGLGYFFLR